MGFENMEIKTLAVVCYPRAFPKRMGLSDGVHWSQHVGSDGLDCICFALHVFSFDGRIEHLFTNEQFGPEVDTFFRVLTHFFQRVYDWFVPARVHKALERLFAPAHANFEHLLLLPFETFHEETRFKVNKGDHFYKGMRVYIDSGILRMYFVGNVLSPTATQPEQHDKTFAFTRTETEDLNLQGVPIRMEHDGQMEVGTVQRSWTGNDGAKWIVGKLNDKGFNSIFAKHAIAQQDGTPYYTGLSLQHTHTQYASGATMKEAVEVSLCCDPRRSDCRIVFVSKIPSGKTPYKTTHSASQMPETVQQVITETAAAEVEAPPSTVVQDTEAEVLMPPQELMEIVVQQEKHAADMQRRLDAFEQAESGRIEKLKAKNSAMAQALVENWSSSLNADDFDADTRQSILSLAETYPKETADFFRVAHHASQKYVVQQKQQDVEVMKVENSELKKTFNKVMSKQVHAASTKAIKQKAHFMTALNKYRVKGHGRDLMDRVMDMQQPKRRKMY